MGQAENLTKAERIRKFGEVFTPPEIVERMLDMLEQEDPGCFAPEKTFLEPTCGEGVFVLGILRRKFANCRTDAERRTAIRSAWAMELQADNVAKTIRAVTEYCESVLRLTKADREAIRDHVIQADSLKVMKMMNELNEREPDFTKTAKFHLPVPREMRDCGEAFVEGFARGCVAESMRNVSEECAAEMTEELIRGTAKMFGVPAGLVLDGARAASVWIPVELGHLPKDREIVLGLSRKGKIQLYEYWAPVGNESRGHFYTTRWTEVDVTHWLPKPKLPEETTNSKADET